MLFIGHLKNNPRFLQLNKINRLWKRMNKKQKEQ
jgi:hypothetical protein